MNEEQKQIFRDYATVETKLTKLEEEKKLLRVKVVDVMNETENEKVVSEFGTFSVVPGKKSYVYTETIQEMVRDVSAAKKNEEESGAAQVSQGEAFLRFSTKKSEWPE